jgi:hypothetical protein
MNKVASVHKRPLLAVACWFLFYSFTPAYGADQSQVETIIAIRHGETPPFGLGQLSCRGLNRALALPNIWIARYGRPDFIFAPNPSSTNRDFGKHYFYVRPLVTIEPTAIRLSMPVNTQFGYTDVLGLKQELADPIYANSLIFIAWEHAYLDIFIKNMMQSYGGDPATVPTWPNDDFGSIFIIRVIRRDGHTSVSFKKDSEGLSDQITDTCPNK